MLGSILIFLLVLSVIVMFHEFGHFWTARKAGILVEEFGFGLPPRIYGKKIGETIYSINLLPFGGFVRLHGENNEGKIANPDRAFVNKSKRARAIVVMAGVAMNFILAFAAFSFAYSTTGVPRETGEVKIVQVDEGTPASEVGLKAGDIVLTIDGQSIVSTENFTAVASGKDELNLKVKTEDGEKNISVTPRKDYPKDQGPLGIVISSSEVYYPPVWQRPFYGMYFGFKESIFWGKAVLAGFASLFSQLFSGHVPAGISGPVGIYAVTTEAASYGYISLINFIGILSVNLAILNAVPFPALDGGRLLFIVLETILGKKVLPKIENAFHTAGMALLLLLLVVITVVDVKKLIAAGSIANFIQSFAP